MRSRSRGGGATSLGFSRWRFPKVHICNIFHVSEDLLEHLLIITGFIASGVKHLGILPGAAGLP